MWGPDSQIAPDEIAVALAQLSNKGKLIAANSACCALLGVTLPEVANLPFDQVFVAADSHQEDALRARLLRNELAHYSSERSFTRKDGTTVPLQVEFSLQSGERLEAPILAVMQDLSGFRAAEAALQESENARHELARRLTNAQEIERTRIARELHDDIGQSLAILRIQMLRAGQPVSGLLGRRHPTIPELCENIRVLAEKISRISHQLHSSELEYLGLGPAVQSHCREFAEKYKIAVHCSCQNIPEKLDGLLALSLLRIVQEALHNAGKHSSAKNIEVTVQGSPSELTLLIADDGVGFDLEEAKLAAGLGLISMRERVHLAGGDFKLDSEPGAGTTIRARVPLDAVSEDLS